MVGKHHFGDDERKHVCVLCVIISSILIASRHFSVFMGASAGVAQEDIIKRLSFRVLLKNLRPAELVLAFLYVARSMQQSLSLIDRESEYRISLK